MQHLFQTPQSPLNFHSVSCVEVINVQAAELIPAATAACQVFSFRQIKLCGLKDTPSVRFKGQYPVVGPLSPQGIYRDVWQLFIIHQLSFYLALSIFFILQFFLRDAYVSKGNRTSGFPCSKLQKLSESHLSQKMYGRSYYCYRNCSWHLYPLCMAPQLGNYQFHQHRRSSCQCQTRSLGRMENFEYYWNW